MSTSTNQHVTVELDGLSSRSQLDRDLRANRELGQLDAAVGSRTFSSTTAAVCLSRRLGEAGRRVPVGLSPWTGMKSGVLLMRLRHTSIFAIPVKLRLLEA